MLWFRLRIHALFIQYMYDQFLHMMQRYSFSEIMIPSFKLFGILLLLGITLTAFHVNSIYKMLWNNCVNADAYLEIGRMNVFKG